MARYEIDFTFADGEQIVVRAVGATNYPDALAQLRAEAVEGLKQSITYILAIESVETADFLDEDPDGL